jgi:pimeloyl-ACP methyl ester carboxylesterase
MMFLGALPHSKKLTWEDRNNGFLFFKVPIYFALGKHDHEAPSILAEQYFKIIEAPKKEIIWFENSAHFASIEENEKFNDLLINRILPTIALV